MDWYSNKKQALIALYVSNLQLYSRRVFLESAIEREQTKRDQQLLTNEIILNYEKIRLLEQPLPEEVELLLLKFQYTGYRRLKYEVTSNSVRIGLKPANFFKLKNYNAVLRKFEQQELIIIPVVTISKWISSIDIRFKDFYWDVLSNQAREICNQERSENGRQEDKA